MGLEKRRSHQDHADALVSNTGASVSRRRTIKQPASSRSRAPMVDGFLDRCCPGCGYADRRVLPLRNGRLCDAICRSARHRRYRHGWWSREFGNGAWRAPDADLREAAGASQSSGRREVTAALVQDAEAARHAVPASTAQYRQALEQETLLSDTLAGELAAARSELDTKVALADKAVDEAAQLSGRRRLQRQNCRSLCNKNAKDPPLWRANWRKPGSTWRRRWHCRASRTTKYSSAAKQRKTADELRKSLQQERARAAALASELAGNTAARSRPRPRSRKRQSMRPRKQKQAAEATIAELRQSLEQEQKKTAALMQEAKAAQAMTTSRRATAPRTRRGTGACRSPRERACGNTPRDRDPGRAVAKGSRCGHETEAGGGEPPSRNCDNPWSRSKRRPPP